MTISLRSGTRRVRAAAAALIATSALVLHLPAVAHAATDDDTGLDQTIEQGQQIVHGERVLGAGHVDMGPRIVDGQWQMLIHDDVARADENATSVWRYPNETVFQIVDAGILEAPDDPAYAFLGVAAGDPVWVSPQTQNPDVIWLGWNTQDPDVMATIDRGITLSLDEVQGPGVLTVFLQSGSFGEPDVLWDSRITQTQPIWVDVNTHTHANWAFTQPGVYLVQVTAAADLIDGSTVSDTQVLRFAVGSDTSTDAAMSAAWQTTPSAESPDGTESVERADDPAALPGDAQDPLVPILIVAIAVVAVALVAGIVVVVVRGTRSRRDVLSRRSSPRDEDAS